MPDVTIVLLSSKYEMEDSSLCSYCSYWICHISDLQAGYTNLRPCDTNLWPCDTNFTTMWHKLSTMWHKLTTMWHKLTTMWHKLTTMGHKLMAMWHKLTTIFHYFRGSGCLEWRFYQDVPVPLSGTSTFKS